MYLPWITRETSVVNIDSHRNIGTFFLSGFRFFAKRSKKLFRHLSHTGLLRARARPGRPGRSERGVWLARSLLFSLNDYNDRYASAAPYPDTTVVGDNNKQNSVVRAASFVLSSFVLYKFCWVFFSFQKQREVNCCGCDMLLFLVVRINYLKIENVSFENTEPRWLFRCVKSVDRWSRPSSWRQ